jgi:hypothetical protein
MESVVKSKKYVVPLAVLNPEITAGLVVAYLTDGRFKAPKDTTVEIVPGETVTKGAEPAPRSSGTPSRTLPAGVETRRPLPPATPQ